MIFERSPGASLRCPYGVNPWTTWPIAIVSVDYVKRADVLPAVAACAWDVVVVDEAHGLAGDSDRHEAVAALAARAPYVVLLTATPHNGDARAFRSLCAIGGGHDRLLVFRRTRSLVQPAASRRVHRLLLRPSAEELEMHARLEAFGRAVREERGELDPDVWLALAVLRKRAYSSARALQQTVARRLASLGSEQDVAEQLALPLDTMGESDAADEAPAWQPIIALRDRALERRLLTSLADAAEAAAARETKLSALARLLNRIAEPVIVFTEYRDTLAHVEHVVRSLGKPTAILHGGLSRQERSAALRTFAAGDRAVLLATDAAGEGLNLQGACRIVINLELPWNPMRLEQRIGRVDRIGQRRTVHAFHLVAAGTGEERLLEGLRDRIARAQTEVGAPNPLGDPDAGVNDAAAQSDDHRGRGIQSGRCSRGSTSRGAAGADHAAIRKPARRAGRRRAARLGGPERPDACASGCATAADLRGRRRGRMRPVRALRGDGRFGGADDAAAGANQQAPGRRVARTLLLLKPRRSFTPQPHAPQAARCQPSPRSSRRGPPANGRSRSRWRPPRFSPGCSIAGCITPTRPHARAIKRSRTRAHGSSPPWNARPRCPCCRRRCGSC